jgi:hypothetical protein
MELAWFLSPSIRGGTVRNAHSSGNRLRRSCTTVRASSQISRIETVRKLRRFFDILSVVGAFESFPYAGKMRVTADGKIPSVQPPSLSGLLSVIYLNTTSSLVELSKTAHF